MEDTEELTRDGDYWAALEADMNHDRLIFEAQLIVDGCSDLQPKPDHLRALMSDLRALNALVDLLMERGTAGPDYCPF